MVSGVEVGRSGYKGETKPWVGVCVWGRVGLGAQGGVVVGSHLPGGVNAGLG